MNVRNTLIAVGVALALGGCGGSSNHTAETPSTSTTAAGSGTTSAAASATSTTAAATSTTAAGTATPTGGAPTLGKACSLVTPSQLATLLGAPVAGAGSEHVYEPTYKTCSWNTDQSTGGNLNFVRLGVVVRKTPSDKGFEPSTQAGTPAPVGGIGDNATFASQGGGAGLTGQSELVANKGLVSVSLDVNYGGTVPHPNSNAAAIGAVVRDIFSQLGA